jgi:hypothetical protein
MPRYTVRGITVYKDGRRLGETKTGNFTVTDGGENQIIENGFAGRSKGVNTGTLSITSLAPVSRIPVSSIKAGDTVKITLGPWCGVLKQSEMVCTKYGGDWDNSSGKSDGNWEFEGPEFEDVG